MLHDPGGYAAQEKTSNGAQAFRAGHNQIRLMGLGDLQNLVSRIADRRHLLDTIAGLKQFFGALFHQGASCLAQFGVIQKWHGMRDRDHDRPVPACVCSRAHGPQHELHRAF